MPVNQQQTLAAQVGLSVEPTSLEFFEAVREYFTTQDCIGLKVCEEICQNSHFFFEKMFFSHLTKRNNNTTITKNDLYLQGTGLNTSIPYRKHFDLNVLTSSFTDLYGCRCEEEAGRKKNPLLCLFSPF